MDEHVKDYFREYSQNAGSGNFHKVIPLHDGVDVNWEMISQIAPNLPRGWFELCELPSVDRIQFTREFWLSKLPYHCNIDKIENFFDSLDDIGVYVFQKKYDDPFEVQMVYTISRNRGFYRGFVNATEDEIIDLQKLFPEYILPVDYISFLKIHNGFCKSTDCTGITRTTQMKQRYKEFQEILASHDQVTTKSGRTVNPKSLIPFYESFGMPYYQCFWGEWHPEQEMGNVYYSAADNTISNPVTGKMGSLEYLAFPTFTDWLNFYLEQIEA